MSVADFPELDIPALEDSLVNFVEIWLPDGSTSTLSLESAYLADGNPVQRPLTDASETAAAQAVAEQSVVIRKSAPEQGAGFAVCEPDCDVAAIVAIPVFSSQQLCGVAVLGLADVFGGVEVWSRNDRDELTVTDSHYRGLPSLEFITQYTRFPKGSGVPGYVWRTGEAKLVQDLETNNAFIRSFGKDPAAISMAIGMPIAATREVPNSILLILESASAPLARVTELWSCGQVMPADSGQEEEVEPVTELTGVAGRSSDAMALQAEWRRFVTAQILKTRAPVAVNGDDVALPAGTTFSLAIPIYRTGDLAGVLSLSF